MRRPATLQLEEYDPAAEVMRRVQDDRESNELADVFDLEIERVKVDEYLYKLALEKSRRGEMPKTGTVH